jgi:hypothetical protein
VHSKSLLSVLVKLATRRASHYGTFVPGVKALSTVSSVRIVLQEELDMIASLEVGPERLGPPQLAACAAGARQPDRRMTAIAFNQHY